MELQTVDGHLFGFKEGALGFIFGAALGSAITYYFTKKHYRKIADKEVKSVIESFDNIKTDADGICTGKLVEGTVGALTISSDEMKDLLISAATDNYPKDDVPDESDPEVIFLDDFVNDEEYDKETLIYYEDDGVLTDQYDNVIALGDVFGEKIASGDFVKMFPKDDLLYLRNKSLLTDYEICLEHTHSPETALMEGDIDDD